VDPTVVDGTLFAKQQRADDFSAAPAVRASAIARIDNFHLFRPSSQIAEKRAVKLWCGSARTA
jgi:hypothetical protein